MLPMLCLLFFWLSIALAETVSVYFQAPNPSPTHPPLLPLSASKPVPSSLVAVYYPDWTASAFPPASINFSLVDVVDFAFAYPDQDYNVTWDDPVNSPASLSALVSLAHAQDKKVKLSLGGWDGSKYFSAAMRTDSSRAVFAHNILQVYHAYSLDGVDLDWEYPGTDGEAGNLQDPQDTPNLLLFLRLLRELLPGKALVTVTSTDSTLVSPLGSPTGDMSAFAAVLDWVLLMNYDVNGGWQPGSVCQGTWLTVILHSFLSPWSQCSPE